MPANYFAQQRHVLHGGPQGSDLVEAAGEGDQPVPADPAVGRLQADHAAEGGRLADRAAGVAAQGEGHHAGGHARRRSATRPPRDPLEVPGVPGRVEGRVLVGAPHGEFVHVRFSDQDGIGRFQLLHHGCVVGGAEILQHPRSARRGLVAGTEHVFDGDRQACQGADRFAPLAAAVDLIGLGQGRFATDPQKGLHPIVVGIDPLQAGLDQLDRRQFPGLQPSEEFGGRAGEGGHVFFCKSPGEERTVWRSIHPGPRVPDNILRRAAVRWP